MTNTDEKPLAAAPAAAQDSNQTRQNDVNRKGLDVRRKRRRPTPSQRFKIPPRPENLPFAQRVDAAMKAKGMSASDLAREVWGTVKNQRGYDVARNRDRIGHYLAGTSYPDPANLQRLADALDVPVEELAIERPAIERHSSRRNPEASTGELTLRSLPAQPTKIRLQVDRVIPWELAHQIHEMLKKAEIGEHNAQPEQQHEPGKVINGSKI